MTTLRPSLLPEFHVYGGDGVDLALAGIADAIGFGPDGAPEVIVDWKSDVAPSAAMPGVALYVRTVSDTRSVSE